MTRLLYIPFLRDLGPRHRNMSAIVRMADMFDVILWKESDKVFEIGLRDALSVIQVKGRAWIAAHYEIHYGTQENFW